MVSTTATKPSFRNLGRAAVLPFFAKLPPTEVVLEACGGSHHWARLLSGMGHRVKLIPPQYVKPFVKRGKNNRNDAEAIGEAASRPSMRFLPGKSAEQQAAAMPLSVRELLVRQLTQLINALRGDASEFGLVVPKGIKKADALLADVAATTTIPALAREMIAVIGAEIVRLDARLADIDARLAAQHKKTPMSKLLEGQSGIGPLTALTLTLRVDPKQFQSSRHFAAWLGLVPTGGRQRLGGISREALRGCDSCSRAVRWRSSVMPSQAAKRVRVVTGIAGSRARFIIRENPQA
jgi:transposase